MRYYFLKLKNIIYDIGEFFLFWILFKKSKKLSQSEINVLNKISHNLKRNKKNHWNMQSLKLIKKIKLFGFDNFLRIRIIKDSMFFNNSSILNKMSEKKELDNYKEILNEDSFGNPFISKKFNFTSLNMLHQLQHLKLLSKIIKDKNKHIIEIGGGYGLLSSMIIKNFSNIKTYRILDLELFSFIQKKYLSKCLNKSLHKKIKFVPSKKLPDNFILLAFWSFSEVDLDERKKFMKLIIKADKFIIGYQSKFNDINNEKYFFEIFKKNKIKVKKLSINYINDNFYLIKN